MRHKKEGEKEANIHNVYYTGERKRGRESMSEYYIVCIRGYKVKHLERMRERGRQRES